MPDNNGQSPPENNSTSGSNNEATEPPILVSVTQEEWTQIQEEASEYKDKYLRQLAETDNMRKRLQKEKQELIQHAMENVIVEFLTPIDHMENALKYTDQMSSEVKNWAMGFQMILNQFKEVLKTHGVLAFDSVGTQFDPHIHEAVEIVVTTEKPQGTIVMESVRGYKMGKRTIRPARVAVAKAPSEENSINKEEQAND